MPPKRATYISYGNDERCASIKKYIEDAGILLQVRDLEKQPFTYDDLERTLGHIPLVHFLNPAAESYHKLGYDRNLPDREELLQAIVEDYTLLKRPIIKTIRLLTVGCDKQRITDMLQIGSNSDSGQDSNHNRHGGRGRSTASASR